jgi:type 1 glutamine amidotransferase
VLTLTALALAASCLAAPPIKAVLITGKNNHNWRYTSRVHRDTLEATGLFEVAITDTPETDLAKPGFLDGASVIILDYNDLDQPQRWGQAAEAQFLGAVSKGTGVVAIHAANNSFKGWAEYEKMLGLLWRDGAGHGRFHAFDIAWADPRHPVAAGMPVMKDHPDELYHGLTNPQRSEYRLLARAMSSKDSGGPGREEPMAITLTYGRGRVLATPLGHVWTGDDGSKVSVTDPQFKVFLSRAAEWAATGRVTQGTTWSDTRPQNTLTQAEQAAGWTLLFNGLDLTGWHAFGKGEPPASGWGVKDGALCFTPGSAGGDICTDGEYGDFELSLEWRVGPGGNSGIMYRCTEDLRYPWLTGREYQVLDDARHADGKKPKTRAACMYDMFACAYDVSRPAGEWNHARIIARGTRIEHWLNGFKVVEVDTAGEEYRLAFEASKFAQRPEYGKRATGRFSLQDHGDPVAYRNIKVRHLRD